MLTGHGGCIGTDYMQGSGHVLTDCVTYITEATIA